MLILIAQTNMIILAKPTYNYIKIKKTSLFCTAEVRAVRLALKLFYAHCTPADATKLDRFC